GFSARKLNLCRFQKCGREPQPQSPLERIIGAARENTSSSLERLIACINEDAIPVRLYSYCFFASDNLHSTAFSRFTKCAIKNVPVNNYCFEFVRRIANGPACWRKKCYRCQAIENSGSRKVVLIKGIGG